MRSCVVSVQVELTIGIAELVEKQHSFPSCEVGSYEHFLWLVC